MTSAMPSTTHLATLSLQECWACLRDAPIGRLVYTEHALPAIRPVNFSLHGNEIIIWSLRGGKARALPGQVVAFEVDRVDERSHTGWSVVALGTVDVVSDENELLSVTERDRRPWVTGQFDHVIRIRVREVTGRRLELD